MQMYYLYSLVPVIQIITAVHAIKTGRSWNWLWIILFFPFVGSVVYVIVEMGPDLRRFSFENVAEVFLPGRRLSNLREQVEISDTVENRKNLADHLVRNDRADEAADQYRYCLQGAFKDDPEITMDLCRALLSAKQYDELKDRLQMIERSHPGHQAADRELLYARLLDETGQSARAKDLYERLVELHGGLEPRYRLGHLLERSGERERARTVYTELLKRSKRLRRHFRREQRQWIGLTREGLSRVSKK